MEFGRPALPVSSPVLPFIKSSSDLAFSMFITNRLRWISLVGASLLALAASAHAAERGFYFTGFKSFNIAKKSFDAAPNEHSDHFARSLGFKLSSQWRVETSFASGSEDFDRISYNQGDAPADTRFKSWSGLVNIYYDFDVPGKIEPFVGVGTGFSSKSLPSGGSGDGEFAWQFGGGLKYNFNPSLSFSSAYRFYNEGADTSLSGTADNGQEFRIGFTYKLPVRKKNHARGLNDPAFSGNR